MTFLIIWKMKVECLGMRNCMEPRGRNSILLKCGDGTIWLVFYSFWETLGWLIYVSIWESLIITLSLPCTCFLCSPAYPSLISHFAFQFLQLYFHKIYHLQRNHQYISPSTIRIWGKIFKWKWVCTQFSQALIKPQFYPVIVVYSS